MSMDLATQIRQYAQQVDADQEPLTVGEVMDRYADRSSVRALPPQEPDRRRFWVAAAVAAVVVLAFGLVAWLLRSENPYPAVDSFPAPVIEQTESAYMAPAFVPEGFELVLADAEPGLYWMSNLMYRRQTGDSVWTPEDGAFSITTRAAGVSDLPGDPGTDELASALDERLDQVLNLVPGAVELEVSGQRAILYETPLDETGFAASQVSLLIDHGGGASTWIIAAGMTGDDVVAIAETLEQVPLADLRNMALTVSWTHLATFIEETVDYQVPETVEEASENYVVMRGVDLLQRSPLVSALQEPETPVTGVRGGAFGYVLTTAQPHLAPAAVYAALEQAEGISSVGISPDLVAHEIKTFYDQTRPGTVLAENPFIVQAPQPERPDFDTAPLGEEIPLIPVTDASVIPEVFLPPGVASSPHALATSEYPMVVLGQPRTPDGTIHPTALVVSQFTSGEICPTEITDTSSSRICAFPTGSYGALGFIGSNDNIPYHVPPNTSVVQIITQEASYWQQPIGGYGIIPNGTQIGRPTELAAFTTNGTEIARWTVSEP